MLTDLQRERIYPYAAALLAFAWVICVDRLGYKVPYNDDLLAALVSLGGIFAGFLATLKTLLSAISNASFRRLKNAGFLNDLLLYLKEAIWGALALCVAAMFGFSDAIRFPVLHSAILFALLFFSLGSLYRITKIGMNLLTNR